MLSHPAKPNVLRSAREALLHFIKAALFVLAGAKVASWIIQRFTQVNQKKSLPPATKTKYVHLASIQENQCFDYIVVGGGSAGAVIAARLGKDPKISVLLIEAGPSDSTDMRVHVPGLFSETQKSNIDWNFVTEEVTETRGRRHYWPRGKVLGGCSSTNAMLYVRGNKKDYDLWESQHGCAGWSYERILPYFTRSEGCYAEDVEEEYHGHNGSLLVSRAWDPRKITKDFVLAANKYITGSAEKPARDLNGSSQIGAEISQVTVSPSGTRSNSSAAFLEKSSASNTNVFVATGYRVWRISQSGRIDQNCKKLVDGVVVLKEGATGHIPVTVTARREVILSAGAIGSPTVLLHSGIGCERELSALGIPVLQNLPAVGKHMQDHLFVGVNFRDNSKSAYKKTIWLVLKGICQYLYNRTGVLAAVPIEAIAFLTVGNGKPKHQEPPNLQLHFLAAILPKEMTGRLMYDTISHQPLESSMPEVHNMDACKQAAKEVLQPPDTSAFYFTILPTLLHPTSKGTVKLSSADPRAPPKIQPNYLSTSQDIDTLVYGVEAARQVAEEMRQKGIESCGEERCDESIIDELIKIRKTGPTPVSKNQLNDAKLRDAVSLTREYVEEFIRRYAVTVYHPVGTCRMGPEERKDTVVSHLDLKVHGFGNLRVADASVMPEIVSGNTNAASIMIGEVCAAMVEGRF